MPTAHRSSAPRALVVSLCVVLGLLSLAAQAAAHATLTVSDPANDVVVEQSPARVSLEFTEPVETAFGALQIYDTDKQPVASGEVTRPRPEAVAVAVPDALADGTYAVTWRVVSADGHPISGAFVFHVGAREAGAAGLGDELLADAGSTAAVAAGVVRFVAFALILLVVGLTAALLLVLRDVAVPLRGRLIGLLAALAAGLWATALGQVAMQGATASGLGLSAAFRADVLADVLETRFGRVWLAAAVLAAVLTALAAVLHRRTGSATRPMLLGAGVLVLALAACPALAGHAGAEGTLAVVADAVHVSAAGIWTGGLAAVLAALWLARGERWSIAPRVVSRFSNVAAVAVVGLLVAGTVTGLRQLGTVPALWETGYGQLLMVKLALVAPVLALGAVNNRWAVPRLRARGASAGERRRFVRLAGSELALVAGVVAVTAALVAQPPSTTAAPEAPAGAYATTTALGSLDLNLIVDPATPGTNSLTLYVTDAGRPASVAELTVQAQTAGVGPLRLEGERVAPGLFEIPAAGLAFPGTWELRVEARRGEFEALTQTVSIPIREDD